VQNQVRASIAVLAVVAVAVAAWIGARSGLVAGLGTGVVALGLVAAYGWWSLRGGRHTPWAEARGSVRDGHAVVLWKPGCRYCERLLRALGADERVTWVNVWRDPDANQAVRDLNGGDEYTPTVLVGSAVLRNPTAEEVVVHLG